MGKGTIISAVGDGSYTVTLEYDTAAITAKIALLTAKIADFQTVINSSSSTESEVAVAQVRKLSAQKQKDLLSNTTKVPAPENITAWCADFTTDLTGSVGTIEIGRDRDNGVNIQPGYDSIAVYNSDRDGQLVPAMALSGAGTFYNLCMLPGTQKWRPMYRYGVIDSIDRAANTCNVVLDPIETLQGIDINIDREEFIPDPDPDPLLDEDVDEDEPEDPEAPGIAKQSGVVSED